MKMFIKNGKLHTLYTERLELAELGDVKLRRASHVEVRTGEEDKLLTQRLEKQGVPIGSWYADLSLSQGPLLGPWASRTRALDDEIAWLETVHLPQLCGINNE